MGMAMAQAYSVSWRDCSCSAFCQSRGARGILWLYVGTLGLQCCAKNLESQGTFRDQKATDQPL